MMKVFKFITIALALFLAGTLQGQISVNVHFGSPPQWGPANQSAARYYYLPDIEAYYDIQTSMFIYQRNGIWIRRANLPPQYRNYDLYNGYKVVMTNYRGNTPYTNFREYRTKYAKGYRGQAQRTIGQREGRGNPNTMMRHADHFNKNIHVNSDKNVKQHPFNNKDKDHANKGTNKKDHEKGHENDKK
jgi:hypothetical protein